MEQYVASNAGGSYSSLPSIAPQQLQQNAPLPNHTLPPLQPHHSMSMHSMYGQQHHGQPLAGQHGQQPLQPLAGQHGQSLSAPHTPTNTTPNTPGGGGPGGFQQMGAQTGSRVYQPQVHPYQQLQPYNNSPSMMSQGSGSMLHHPQPIAPAPGPAHNRAIIPMPTSTPLHAPHTMISGLTFPYGQQGPGPGQEQDAPTHVVGSQGRRGILPSAPGRPTVGATGTVSASKSALIPAKDADGKYPCPHCTKTYLHAKHLKRHLLRHTGERPYTCFLCKDTFSRSDILKRHFQKCSIRRGNPTGASHLSAQGHLKKSHQGPNRGSSASSTDGSMMRSLNGINGLPADPSRPFGILPADENSNLMHSLADDQAAQDHLSGSTSSKGMSIGDGRDRRSMTGQGPGGSSRASFDQSYSNDIASTMAPSMNSQLAGFNMPNGHNGQTYTSNYDYTSQQNNHHHNGTLHGSGNDDMAALANGRGTMPIFGGTASGEWVPMFNAGAQAGYVNNFNSNLGQTQMAIKAENSLPRATDNTFTGIYPIEDSSGVNFPSWISQTLQNDPLQQVSTLLTSIFQSSAQAMQGSEIGSYLTPDNIKHFLDRYTNFQGHFPIIHIPTFRITDTYHGLLLAMVCVGAVYSEILKPPQVRYLMEQSKMVIERDSKVFSRLMQDSPAEFKFGAEATGQSKGELEEIQAILLLQILFTWHGTPIQREVARRRLPILAKISRQARLSRLSTVSGSYSVLHQPNFDLEHFNISDFDWMAWVEQEKRSRLFYLIFLIDTATVLYFNSSPQFDVFDTHLPLPADDGAWDAQTADQCAEALGMRGPILARTRNPGGTRLPKQLDMSFVLQALLDPTITLKPGATNVFSKFIVVHALLVQVWQTQRHISQDVDSCNTNGQALSRSGTSTPIAQNGWASRNGEQNGQATNNSGGNNKSRRHSEADLMIINNAIDKWKKAWDEDMLLQYPPSCTSYRRFGFCRDGVHFYYLAKYFMKNRLDWQMSSDQRFTHAMGILKSVKMWVASDSAKRGEELGSVNDIAEEYGTTDLNLDMAQLFQPINKQIDSHVAGVCL